MNKHLGGVHAPVGMDFEIKLSDSIGNYGLNRPFHWKNVCFKLVLQHKEDLVNIWIRV